MANQLALRYTSNPKPSALLNSIFMTTVNTAAKTLVAVASNLRNEAGGEKWKPTDHLRFMFMLTTWLAVWALRILTDHLPFSFTTTSLDDFSHVGSFDFLTSLSSTLSSSLAMFSTTASSSSFLASSLDLSLSTGSCESGSSMALKRALTNILGMVNEIPASSRKYQFAVAMADRIMEENTRSGHVELLEINRSALASSFARTQVLLYRSLQNCNSQKTDDSDSWMTRAVKALPFGSYVTFFMKGVGTFFPTTNGTSRSTKQNPLAITWVERDEDVQAEKHAQELLWITNKMRMCGGVDEAIVQWSISSGLASIALTANPRVQGFIVKITAILLGELIRHEANMEAARQVKFRFLAIWVPLFCFAENGLSYPIMSGYEKNEMERIMDEVISSLPFLDQEVILSNWLQDFTISSSDWPNLQATYDKWCHSTRGLIM